MMFDHNDSNQAIFDDRAFEPLPAGKRSRRGLRGKSGALLTTTTMIAAGAALTLSGEAVAQSVPAGFAPAPADVVSYVQLSNGSVLVKLANQQSLLVKANNFMVDSSGILYLSPSVSSGIASGGGIGRAGVASVPPSTGSG